MSVRSPVLDSLAAAFMPLRQRWNKLELRQQRLAGGGLLLLLAALLFAYVWLPAVRERARLVARLPQLASQLTLMQKQAAEIRQLTSTSMIAPAPPATPDITALQAAFGEGARASVDANRAFHVVVPKIGYASWWDRLADLQARYQLQVMSITMQALQGNGHEVSVDMLLADQTRESKAPSTGGAK